MQNRVAWVVPLPTKGSGGFRTITQNSRALEMRGFICDFYFLPNLSLVASSNQIRQQMSSWFGYCPANIHLNATSLKGSYQLAIATQWDTAEFVHTQDAEHKVYFVQDRESYFYPMGSEYLFAEATYSLDITPITIGSWLASMYERAFKKPAYSTCFGADPTTYKHLEQPRKNALCAIWQPEKPRRASSLLTQALEIVHELKPDLEIYLYGSDAQLDSPTFATNLGVLSPSDINSLYNRCLVGISMSTTNPSRIPFEMMASGLPVIDLYRENNLFDLPDQAVTTAFASPAGIASAVVTLLDDEIRRERATLSGIRFMEGKTTEFESEQFADYCESIVNNETLHAAGLAPRSAYPHVPCPISKQVADVELCKCHQKLLKERAQALPLALASGSLEVSLETDDSAHSRYSLACWTSKDQSDLQWIDFCKDDQGKAHLSLNLDDSTNEPKIVNFHVYGVTTDDARQEFISGTSKLIMIRKIEPNHEGVLTLSDGSSILTLSCTRTSCEHTDPSPDTIEVNPDEEGAQEAAIDRPSVNNEPSGWLHGLINRIGKRL